MGQQDAFDAIMRELTDIKQQLRQVTMTPMPEWVTAKQYAEMTGVTPRTVRNWIASGELETYRHGKTAMVRASQAFSRDRRRSH